MHAGEVARVLWKQLTTLGALGKLAASLTSLPLSISFSSSV